MLAVRVGVFVSWTPLALRFKFWNRCWSMTLLKVGMEVRNAGSYCFVPNSDSADLATYTALLEVSLTDESDSGAALLSTTLLAVVGLQLLVLLGEVF